MSRNVELSSEREKEPALSRTTGDAPASGAGEPRRPNLEARAREEATRCVQRVFLAPGASAPRVVVVCAAEPGDGCTWVCASLGKTLASLTKGSVCLVDANLRSPFLYRHFGGEGLRGLTVVDRGTVRSSARQLGSSNLWLMSCAEPASDALAALTSDAHRERIAGLRAAFQYVLIDSGPVNACAEPVMLGQLADGVVLVVKSNSTKRESVWSAKESLEAAGVRFLGAVLNARDFPLPEALYRRL